MKREVFAFALIIGGLVSAGAAQPVATSTPKKVNAEGRERAFAAMLEGQRHLWLMSRTRSQASQLANATLAKAAFTRALEIDPGLAEAYTALAEIAVSVPPGDAAAAIDLAKRAIAISKDNIGAHRIVARLHTYRSGLNNNQFDASTGRLAVASWSEIARIDSRDSEAWAFLAELYDRLSMPTERIAALRKWQAGAQPTDPGFYRRTLGSSADLRPEAAAFKLGSALAKAGENREAIETLSLVIADSPENTDAVELLSKTIENADAAIASLAIQPLQQAVFESPTSLKLVRLLADVRRTSGRLQEAIDGLVKTSARVAEADRGAAADIEVILGDVYAEEKQVTEAVAAYEKALRTRDIAAIPVAATDREFAIRVFGKIIDVYRTANRLPEANVVRDRARRLLETADLFAVRQ